MTLIKVSIEQRVYFFNTIFLDVATRAMTAEYYLAQAEFCVTSRNGEPRP